jgi:hypothetical protein
MLPEGGSGRGNRILDQLIVVIGFLMRRTVAVIRGYILQASI